MLFICYSIALARTITTATTPVNQIVFVSTHLDRATNRSVLCCNLRRLRKVLRVSWKSKAKKDWRIVWALGTAEQRWVRYLMHITRISVRVSVLVYTRLRDAFCVYSLMNIYVNTVKLPVNVSKRFNAGKWELFDNEISKNFASAQCR